MNRVRFVSMVAALLVALAGCATRLVPYEPGPVRIGSVDYREASGPQRAPGDWKLLLSKDRLLTDDALTASLLLDPGALGKKSVLRVVVARAEPGVEPGARASLVPSAAVPADEITLVDLRNTQIDIHVYFVGAPPGRDAVSAELTPAAGGARRTLETPLAVAERS